MGEDKSQLALIETKEGKKSQSLYIQAIARRCAELGVKPDILPLNSTNKKLAPYKAFIIAGSRFSVNDESLKYNPAIFDGTRPVLGVCFGMQLMNHALGGTVVSAKDGRREYGQTNISVNPESPLFQGLDDEQRVLMSHGDSVDKLAEGFSEVGNSNGLVAAIQDASRRMYGVQFHPEMYPITKRGQGMFENFLYGISGLSRGEEVTIDCLLGEAKQYVRDHVGKDDKVFMLLSGGVDSTVALKIVTEAIGPERVYGLIMDTGFMRKGEPEKVFDYLYGMKPSDVSQKTWAAREWKGMGQQLELVRAASRFMNAKEKVKRKMYKMSEATDAEVKRAIFRKVYKQVALDYLKKNKADFDRDWIVQGTLATDIAETGQIKTHHNVDLGFKNELKPLQFMHKDEVRAGARALGLPENVASRQPFPGPGLLVRTPCAEKPNISEDYHNSQEKVRKIAREHGLSAMMLPIVTVGAQGDSRTYTHPVLLWGKRDWKAIDHVADIIPRQVHDVNRVEYLLNTAQPLPEDPEELIKLHTPLTTPLTDDPEKLITPTHINPETIALVQQACDVMDRLQESYGLDKRISQLPGCMLPVSLGKQGSRMFSMRPIFTPDFYAGMPGLIAKDESKLPEDDRYQFIPEQFLDDVTAEVLKVPGLDWVTICRTAKPPTTTEPE